jgi:DNA invertase Pin-like site-specific DNA recombinase
MNLAYQRVSTVNQDLRRQQAAFDHLKIDRVYQDKQTGSNLDRPSLNQLRLDVHHGDNIYCESISRLGRNVDELRQLVEEFKEAGVTVHFIKEGLSTSGQTYKFMLTVLGAMAEFEREVTNERVREGMVKAKRYGTRSGKPIGRPGRQLPAGFDKYYPKWKAKEISAVEFARLLQVSRASLYNYIKLREATR